MTPLVVPLALVACAQALRTGLAVGRPTPQALSQALEEAQLLNGFRQEGGAEPVQFSTMDAVAEGASALADPNAGVCQMITSGALCYSERQAALLPPATPHGLVGHWSFDEDQALDNSGNGNHGVTELLHGPSPLGEGHSAKFTTNFITIPNSVQFHLQEYTYTFWIYLENRPDEHIRAADDPDYCPIIRKGIHEDATKQYANAPSITMQRRTGRLRISITTVAASGGKDGEFFESNGRVLPRRWMHVALVRREGPQQRTDVYLNGILDSSVKTHGVGIVNEYPLYIGGDPFNTRCDQELLIDELRLYGRPISANEVAAEAAPAMAGVDPFLVRLGCKSCSLEEAVQSCPPNRHICTSLELHTGGYQTARSLGWLETDTKVWTHGNLQDAQRATQAGIQSGPGGQLAGLGLCCSGPPP